MDYDYNELVNNFKSDPYSAIEKCQEIICSVSKFDSYRHFFSYHLDNAHISTCQNEWSSPELCIFCRNCSIVNNSCICLSCFLNGNHKGHDYVILSGTNGNCDCGDLTQWKRSGCCSKHRGLDDHDTNPQDYLDKNLQTVLTDIIFKAAFSSLANFTTTDTQKAILIIQFISSFLKFGDGFRRLIAISITEKFDLKGLMKDMINYSQKFNQSLQQLFGGLINDQLFLRNLSNIVYFVLNDSIFKDTPNLMMVGGDNVSYAVWNDFWFQFFSEKVLEFNITQKKFDWVDFFCTNLAYMKEVFPFIGRSNYNDFPNSCVTISYRVSEACKIQPNEETQLFFDKMVAEILSKGSLSGLQKGIPNDSIIIASFKETTENSHYLPLLHFILFFYVIFDCFKNKPNLKYGSLFEALDNLLDISSIFYAGKNPIGNGNGKENENDKFVLKLLNQKPISGEISPDNYKSFHNGAAFFFSHPLSESVASLLRLDSISQVKIARVFSSEKYQSLRIKLGISIMKTIASFIAYRQSISAVNNKGVTSVYEIFNKPRLSSKFFSRFVPLFQLLVGIKCTEKTENDEFGLKEFFAFELAREFGLFDDFSSVDYKDENINEKQKQMLFSFLYMSLLLVIERTLFHFNSHNFAKEQIVFALKQGVHSIDQINQLYDKSVFEAWNHCWGFNDVLMSIASTNKKENDDNEENQESSKSFQKDVLFYLKDGVEWNPISAINSINGEMTIMNEEISKNSDKLLKIPEFQPEETFFFSNENSDQNTNNSNENNNNDNDNSNENNNNNNNIDGLSIQLKQFLMTPTVLAIVYHTLRVSAGIDSPMSDLNDHLAMNILVLIAKFIKEEKNDSPKMPINATQIKYSSLYDLITKMKNEIFKYRVEKQNIISRIFSFITKYGEIKEEQAFIENTLDENNFVSLMKIKFSFSKLPPKSFIEVLLGKGKLGKEVLNQISSYIHLDCIDENDTKHQNTAQDIKLVKHQKAAKLKEDIMNHYKSMIANYNTSNQLQQKGMDSIDDIGSISNSESYLTDKEVCSICSTHKKNEIFSYPLYIYRTKFPFIIDKPPKINKEDVVDEIAIDDNLGDVDIKIDEIEDENEEEHNNQNQNEENEIIMDLLAARFPQLVQTEGLSESEIEERQQTLMVLFNSIMNQRRNEREGIKERIKYEKEFKTEQIKENEEYKHSKENIEFKQVTAGANFVIQFGICQHPVHLNCVQDEVFTCPIDRSIKNGLLPSLDMMPKSVIFKNLETFELNDTENTLGENAIKSINSFIEKFTSFFNNSPINVFVELIKSISGLISTYEIRLRSLPDCLDSEKTKILSRNLFLNAWYSYRIQGKPKICLPNKEENFDVETRLTVFQRFIKKLIENDKNESSIVEIVSSIINSNDDLNEKELCLFLRRVCLAEFFLLNKDDADFSPDLTNIIDWDEILSPMNLAKRYNVEFKTIDEDFEFKPFSFINLPKEFLRLNEKPFDLPIKYIEKILLFSIFDYNYLINNYNEISGDIKQLDVDNEIKKNKKNLSSCNEKMIGHYFIASYCKKFYPSVILFVGNYASQVLVIDQNYFGFFDTFYLDKYGCADIGYKRSQPLFLNEERFERFTDMLLSGDFTNSLISINRLID